MTLDQIKGLPIADLVDPKSSHCWLWVTNATLRHGYDVLEAWRFTPRSPLTWIKSRFTLGQYSRNATEHVLLGTRGRAPGALPAQPTSVFAPLQDHSHKPEEQYDIIERVSPDRIWNYSPAVVDQAGTPVGRPDLLGYRYPRLSSAGLTGNEGQVMKGQVNNVGRTERVREDALECSPQSWGALDCSVVERRKYCSRSGG